MLALVPKEAGEFDPLYIDIIINLSTARYQDNFFEAAITPGEKFRIIYNNRNSNNKQ